MYNLFCAFYNENGELTGGIYRSTASFSVKVKFDTEKAQWLSEFLESYGYKGIWQPSLEGGYIMNYIW